jgi:hypothetical protein
MTSHKGNAEGWKDMGRLLKEGAGRPDSGKAPRQEAKPIPQRGTLLAAPRPDPTPAESEDNRKKRTGGRGATLLGAY